MSSDPNDTSWHWSNKGIHRSTQDTRQRAYERCREDGVTHDNAKRIAEDTARQAHEALERKG